jgi:hypothetical protein
MVSSPLKKNYFRIISKDFKDCSNKDMQTQTWKMSFNAQSYILLATFLTEEIISSILSC